MSSCQSETSVQPELIPDIVVESEINSEELSDEVGAEQEEIPTVRLLEIPRVAGSTCGFHLTRSKWDPYPWISAVDPDSPAQLSGLQPGDCVLEVNSEDVLGMRIAAVARLVAEQENFVSLLLWSSGQFSKRSPETLCDGPMPTTLQRLSASVAAILNAIECPVCLDTISPPALQCVHGHLVCSRCRHRSERCPVCRERYGKARSLLADQVFNALTDAFELRVGPDELPPGKIREKLFGQNKKSKKMSEEVPKPQTVSHTQKFLAKIMGKSYSVDNLSSNALDDKKNLSVSNEDFSSFKSKSQSTNEIFRPQSPISIPRCPSARRLEWAGSNDSSQYLGHDLVGNFGTRRPVSRATSAECLTEFREEEEEIILQVPDVTLISSKDEKFPCPYREDCMELYKGSDLTNHISMKHGPLMMWNSVAELHLPLEDTMTIAHLVLMYQQNTFHLKINISDPGCRTNSKIGDVLIWCWLQDSSAAAERFLLEVKIKGNEISEDVEDIVERTGMKSAIGKDICARSAVYSLKDTKWQDIQESRRGIFFTEETLSANLGNMKSLNLRIEILPVL